MGDNLYVTERIELTGLDAADIGAALREYSDDAEIRRAVGYAWWVLEAEGYDVRRSPNLLLDDTKKHEAHHLCARVIYHANRMDGALQDHRILDMRRHTWRFAQAVERAQHLEAWGEAVRQKRKSDAANRRNIARHNAKLRAEANEYWAPWQEAYRALRAAGISEGAARREIGGRIAGQMGQGEEPPDETTLRKWLSG